VHRLEVRVVEGGLIRRRQGQAESHQIEAQELLSEARTLQSFSQRVAAASREHQLGGQQREAILSDGTPELLDTNAAPGQIRQQLKARLPIGAMQAIEQPLTLEVRVSGRRCLR
jgi:hypothetical protein